MEFRTCVGWKTIRYHKRNNNQEISRFHTNFTEEYPCVDRTNVVHNPVHHHIKMMEFKNWCLYGNVYLDLLYAVVIYTIILFTSYKTYKACRFLQNFWRKVMMNFIIFLDTDIDKVGSISYLKFWWRNELLVQPCKVRSLLNKLPYNSTRHSLSRFFS